MTAAFDHAAFFAAARPMFGGKLTQAQVDGLNAALRAGFGMALASPVYPPWTGAGLTKLGEREFKGAGHNPFIVEEMWIKLGAPWLKTDDGEGPWCGGFAAWCVNAAGLAYPKDFPKAASWATWGVACPPQVGAFVVKARVGGNHVAQLVGITADGHHYLALGGNQGDAVSIAPMLVADVNAVRWPANVAQMNIALPVMEKKTSLASEA